MRGNRKLKFLDRTVGYFLLLVIRLFHKRRARPKVQTITFFIPAAIGDSLLIGLIAEDLKRKNPLLKLYLVGSKESTMVAPFFQAYDEVHAISVGEFWRTLRKIRCLNSSVLLDFSQWSKISAIYAALAPGYRVGFKTPGFWRSFCYDQTVNHSASVHEFINFRNLVSKGLGVELPEIPHFIGEKEICKPQVVLHMMPSGERSHLKLWPEKNWFHLIKFFTQSGRHVFLTGSKEDRPKLEAFLSECQLLSNELVHITAGQSSLSDTKKLIAESELIISVNTGVMHLASLMNKNVISLNGPTNSQRWGGLGENTINIQSRLPCSPCLNLGFEYGSNANDCMKAITVDEVIERVKGFGIQ